MTGTLPFYSDTADRQETFKKILACEVTFSTEQFDDISKEAKDLMKRILVKNPYERITMKYILKHKWFKDYRKVKTIEETDLPILQKLKEFKNFSKLKREAMKMLINISNSNEFKHL